VQCVVKSEPCFDRRSSTVLINLLKNRQFLRGQNGRMESPAGIVINKEKAWVGANVLATLGSLIIGG
jgi:hypothetical protein